MLRGNRHLALPFAPPTSHRRSCPASSVWQGAGTRHLPKPQEPLLRCVATHLSWHHDGSRCIPARPLHALPTTSSHSRHAASQKRPPRVETRKTGATQSISKAVRGLPIVERRGSIVPGLHRVPCPFATAWLCVLSVKFALSTVLIQFLRCFSMLFWFAMHQVLQ